MLGHCISWQSFPFTNTYFEINLKEKNNFQTEWFKHRKSTIKLFFVVKRMSMMSLLESMCLSDCYQLTGCHSRCSCISQAVWCTAMVKLTLFRYYLLRDVLWWLMSEKIKIKLLRWNLFMCQYGEHNDKKRVHHLKDVHVTACQAWRRFFLNWAPSWQKGPYNILQHVELYTLKNKC